jgi:hypothetical protein
MVTGLADPVRDLPAGKQAATLDAGPASGTPRGLERTGRAFMHVESPFGLGTGHALPMPGRILAALVPPGRGKVRSQSLRDIGFAIRRSTIA